MKFATWEKVSFGILIAAWAVFLPHLIGDFRCAAHEQPEWFFGTDPVQPPNIADGDDDLLQTQWIRRIVAPLLKPNRKGK